MATLGGNIRNEEGSELGPDDEAIVELLARRYTQAEVAVKLDISTQDHPASIGESFVSGTGQVENREH